MSGSQRIRGQEVSVLIVRGGELENELTDIMSFNVEVEGEIKTQGFLGEKTNRKDDIFNGIKFDMEMQLHKADFFRFMLAVIRRMKRETPDLVINISSVLSFPSGESVSVLIPDAKFGAMPVSIASRGDYVKVKLQGEADDFDPQIQ